MNPPRFQVEGRSFVMDRSSGVTLAAFAFDEADFIKYSRGTIEILDRRGLESEACECYAVTRRELKFPRADRLEAAR